MSTSGHASHPRCQFANDFPALDQDIGRLLGGLGEFLQQCVLTSSP
ncbi:hypothetical protein OG763_03000 [Streptomyces sp. NBC_01230]|nr:hypothetical protein OG763_03000 [Streptomyces sp. NBC_01230]